LPRSERWLGAVAVDATAVVVFAVAGRNAHDESSGASAVLTIAAPFLLGLLAGWLLDPRTRARPTATATGVTVWLATAAIGLLLRRVVWDRGTAMSFVIVATVVLGVLLVGWRAIWAIAQRRRGLQCGVAAVEGGELDGGTVINLYVGNLPFSTTSDDLAALFGRVGDVQSAQVITDRETGRSRGFGFVEMSDEDARKAIDELTGADLGGRSITVNEARPRAPRGGGGGNYRR
jgi:hypothetical protein